MKTKIFSIILIIIVLISFSMNGKSFATSNTSIKVTSDKATANVGDTINYTITANATGEITVLDFYLDIPEGLTYVNGSGKVGTELSSISEKDFTENDLGEICTFANDKPFALNNIQLATFQCKVNDNANGNYTVGIKELEVADENFTEISNNDVKKELTKIEVKSATSDNLTNKEGENKAESETTTKNETETETESSENEKASNKNPVVKIGETINVKSLFNLGDNEELLKNTEITSSNNDVIVVNENGTVVAKETGKAILTVKTSNGDEQQLEIEVVKEDINNFSSDAEGGQTINSESTDTKENTNFLVIIVIIIALIIIATVIYKKKCKKNSKIKWN